MMEALPSWLTCFVQVCNSFDFPLSSWLTLCVAAKAVHATIKPVVERKYTFRIPKNGQLRFYSPHTAVIRSPKSIPSAVKTLTISKYFKGTLPANLPHTITYLTVDCSIDLPALPPNITHLTLKNNSIISPLPQSLTHLNLYGKCTLQSLHHGLTHLTIGNANHEPLPTLPDSLIHFATGYSFAQPINLPQSIKSLTIGSTYLRQLGSLPRLADLSLIGSRKEREEPDFPSVSLSSFSSLEHLFITSRKISRYEGDLPPLLTRFTMLCDSARQIDLPSNLTHLTVAGNFNSPINLPSSVTHIRLGHHFNHPITFPPNLISLEFGTEFNQPIDSFPATITHMTFGEKFWHPLNNFPPGLQYLCCDSAYPFYLRNLPPTLTKLSVRQFDCESLPSSITDLCFATILNPVHEIYQQLPILSCLQILNLSRQYMQNPNPPIPTLPSTITSLSFELHYVYPNNFPSIILPTSITHLALGMSCNIPLKSLPSSITHLRLGANFNNTISPIPPFLVSLTLFSRMSTPLGRLPPSLKVFHFDKDILVSRIESEYMVDCPIVVPCGYPIEKKSHVITRSKKNKITHSIKDSVCKQQ